jgi:hypothetical protein
MTQKITEYKILSTRKCIEYIETNGRDLKDNNWGYSIPSGCGIVYTLSNGEFVLIPNNLKENYPGFIFNDFDAFNQCVVNDHFPIDLNHMTWLEAEASSVKHFLADSLFYSSVIEKELKIELPSSLEEFRLAFDRLAKYVNKKSNDRQKKLILINCYGLALSKYLIEKQKYPYELRKQYEIYNPYYTPILIRNAKKIDVIAQVLFALRSNSKNAFDLLRDFSGLS